MTNIINSKAFKSLRQQLRVRSSDPEQILWKYLKGKQLAGFKFRRQYGIGRFIVDFCCPSCKLAIEIDGESHVGEKVYLYDCARQKFIESLGYRVIRIGSADIYHSIQNVLEGILFACSPPPTPPQKGGEEKKATSSTLKGGEERKQSPQGSGYKYRKAKELKKFDLVG